ncbi:hypothetical protein TNCV_1156191 [Trichonephila clavipes]|nr:hypothetical protein TNCV_1156191 [Trichonephila clavipes]
MLSRERDEVSIVFEALDQCLKMSLAGRHIPYKNRENSERKLIRRLQLTLQHRPKGMAEFHKVVFSDESGFCLSNDSRRVPSWRRSPIRTYVWNAPTRDNDLGPMTGDGSMGVVITVSAISMKRGPQATRAQHM